jgi:hypothetical protein
MSEKSLLFLVDQPWQTEFAIQIINRIRSLDSSIKSTLLLCDFYTFMHEPNYLEALRIDSEFDILDFKKIYQNWDTLSADHDHSYALTREAWEIKYGGERSLWEIERTNQLIYGFERESYILPIAQCCRSQIFFDMTLSIEKLIDTLSPSAIVSIERQTLAVNLSQVIATRKRIGWFSILPSRVGTRWMLWNEFGLGMSEEKFREISVLEISAHTTEKIDSLIDQMAQHKVGSYITWMRNQYVQSGDYLEQITVPNGRLRVVFRWIVSFLKQAKSRFLIHPKGMAFQGRMFEYSKIKLTLFEIRSLFVRIKHLIIPSRLFVNVPNDLKFIFWGLHVRPEGSSNVLSLGEDEIHLLTKFASGLPENLKVVVKENPIMFGQRKLNFYKKLSKVPNVVLVDPDASSINLILQADGVAGVSGTVLLEGQLLSKPTICFGRPEFEKFLSFRGFDSLDKYIESVLTGVEVDNSGIRRYVAYILSNSHEKDIPEFGDLYGENGKQMVSRLTQELLDAIVSI